MQIYQKCKTSIKYYLVLYVKSLNKLWVLRELLLEMEKVESNYDIDIMNRTLEKKKLLPITDHITNDFAEMLHKRLEQLESHNSKLKIDLKLLEDNVKYFISIEQYNK